MYYNPDCIDAAAEEIRFASRVPGLAVAICASGGRHYTRGFGYTDFTHRRPVHGRTGFRIGSVTKGFTACALAILREAGKLEWDDAIEQRLPYLGPQDSAAGGKPTLRDALSHQAGFGWHDPLWYNSPWDRSAVVRRARAVRSGSLERGFYYSNLGFILAGEVLSHAASTTYEDFVCRRLLAPLGMQNSGFALRPEMATGCERICAGHYAPVSQVDIHKANPACGLISCAHDLAVWLKLMLGCGRVRERCLLGVDSVAQLFQPQVEIRREQCSRLFSYFGCTSRLHYGLGWILSEHRGRALISHTGSLPGYRAHLTFIPEERIGIAVLANLSHTWAPDALVYTLLDQFFGFRVNNWIEHFRRVLPQPAVAEQSQTYRRQELRLDPRLYCGSYTNTAYGNVTVRTESETLTFQWTNYRSRMRATGTDQFFLEDLDCPLLADNREVRFRRMDNGEVEGLEFVDTRFQRSNHHAALELT